jgi:hypothetical protein
MPRKGNDKQVERFRAGARTISARQLNGLVDGVNRALTGVNTPTQPRPYGKSGGGGAVVLVLTLVTHEDDYLVCQAIDSTEYLVAKPYELRRTPFDGETIDGVTYAYDSSFATSQERTATSGPDEEVQFITPAYRVGAEIFAVLVQGDTGVDPSPSGAAITYLEMNQGRAWAYDPDE